MGLKTVEDMFREYELSPWWKKKYWSLCGWLRNKPKDIVRYPGKLLFRIKHGFWKYEVWDLFSHTTDFVLPRLEYYHAHMVGYPGGDITMEDWKEIVNKMIIAFRIVKIRSEDSLPDSYSEENNKKVKEGLALFAEYFETLWD